MSDLQYEVRLLPPYQTSQRRSPVSQTLFFSVWCVWERVKGELCLIYVLYVVNSLLHPNTFPNVPSSFGPCHHFSLTYSILRALYTIAPSSPPILGLHQISNRKTIEFSDDETTGEEEQTEEDEEEDEEEEGNDAKEQCENKENKELVEKTKQQESSVIPPTPQVI